MNVTLLTAEPNPARDLITMQSSLLAAEPNPAYDLIRDRSLLMAGGSRVKSGGGG